MDGPQRRAHIAEGHAGVDPACAKVQSIGQKAGGRDGNAPGGNATDAAGEARRPGARERRAQNLHGRLRRQGKTGKEQKVCCLRARRRVPREEQDHRLPQRAHGQSHRRHAAGCSDRVARAKAARRVLPSAPEQVTGKNRDRHAKRAKGEQHKAHDPHAERHAGYRRHRVPGQPRDTGQQGHAARLRGKVAQGGWRSDAPDTRRGDPVPAPGGERGAAKDAPARSYRHIADETRQGGKKRGPRHSGITPRRQAPATKAETRAPHKVDQRHKHKGGKGEPDKLVRTEHGIQHDHAVIEGKLRGVGCAEHQENRRDVPRHKPQPQRRRQGRERQRRHQTARQKRNAHNQSTVAQGAPRPAAPKRLTDRGHAAAAHNGNHQHEQSERLRDKPERGQHVPVNLSSHPDIRHGNGQMTQHQPQLRNRKAKDLAGRTHALGHVCLPISVRI